MLEFINPMKLIKLSTTLLFLTVTFLFFTGCRTVSTGENTNGSIDGVEKTKAPYADREPEKYQTEIWQTSARGMEKFFLTRDGERWRMDSSFGAPEQVTTIHTDKEYVISMATKVYAEYPIAQSFDDREDMVSAMTFGMLNARTKAVYEKLGTDGGMTKYRVITDDGKGKEAIVYFDDKLGLPVKKEIFKAGEAGKTPEITVELSGFKAETDEKLFVLPEGLKKIPADEMRKLLSGGK